MTTKRPISCSQEIIELVVEQLYPKIKEWLSYDFDEKETKDALYSAIQFDDDAYKSCCIVRFRKIQEVN